MKFGEYIYSRGYTVRGLAKEAKVNHRSLENYTSGRFTWENSRLWFAHRVAGALGITTSDLLKFE